MSNTFYGEVKIRKELQKENKIRVLGNLFLLVLDIVKYLLLEYYW